MASLFYVPCFENVVLFFVAECFGVRVDPDVDVHLRRPLVRHLQSAALQEHCHVRQAVHHPHLGDIVDRRLPTSRLVGHDEDPQDEPLPVFDELRADVGRQQYRPVHMDHFRTVLRHTLPNHVLHVLPHSASPLEADHTWQ